MKVLRLAALTALSVCAYANVELPYLIADHMVVQRGLPVHIWGRAEPGESVTLAFRGAERRVTTDALGRWEVYLPPGEAGGPFEMQVRGVNAISLNDVLVGDVWVASGQSNMEWPLSRAANGEAEVAAAKYPRIRLYRAMHKISEFPVENLVGQGWRPCAPESAADFSAVAYHFGVELQERLGIPIGLIQTAWGGTRLEAWTSLGAITKDPALMPVLADWDRAMNDHALALLRYHRAAKDWEKAVPQWKAQHKLLPPPPERPLGPASPRRPGGLFNAMVAPVTRFGIRGVIWYQGEANADEDHAPIYGRLFQAMIRSWRAAWGIGDFPFLYAQLSSYNAEDNGWPELREGQRQALALRNTAMAVTIDVGTPENIHPPDKKTVGRRLSLAARALSYGENVEYSGPLPRQVTAEADAIRIWFDHAAGLAAHGGPVRGFEIAGDDGRFVPAEARVEGDTVVAGSAGIERPIRVRYGWKNVPEGNLFNAAGLPASPFRWE